MFFIFFIQIFNAETSSLSNPSKETLVSSNINDQIKISDSCNHSLTYHIEAEKLILTGSKKMDSIDSNKQTYKANFAFLYFAQLALSTLSFCLILLRVIFYIFKK